MLQSGPKASGRTLRLDAALRSPHGPLSAFLRGVRPDIEEVLYRRQLDANKAEALLSETIRSLAWKWDSVRNRKAWLLAVLDRKCSLLAAGSCDEKTDASED